MAYKNTAGNLSIANQFGTWRYFNSGIAKLGEYKGANLNIDSSNVTKEVEGDWQNAVLGAFNQIGKATDAYVKAEEKRAEDLADKYFKNRSIDQYRQDVQNNAVPFQDNPYAMARLKYLHGRMAYNLTYQDFMDEVVNTNKLQGKSQVEVDAEFYKYAKESQKDLQEAFGYSMDDKYFNEGFFETSPEGRLKAIAQKEAVENKWTTEKALIADSANIAAIINSGDPAASKTFMIYLDQLGKSTGAHYSPREIYSLLSGGLTAASKSRYGYEFIQSIADQEIPVVPGTTFRQLLGDDKIKQMLVDSETFKATDNAMEYSHWQDNIDKYVEEGDYGSLLKLKDQEYLSNNNVETPRTKYLDQAIRRAKIQAKSNLKGSTTDGAKELYRQHIDGLFRGDPATLAFADSDDKFAQLLKDRLGVTLTERVMRIVGDEYAEGILNSGDSKSISRLLDWAAGTAPSTIRTPVSKMLSQWGDNLTHAIADGVATGKVTPKEAVDLLTGKDGEKFDYTIPGTNRVVSFESVSPGLAKLLTYHSINPSAVRQILTNSKTGDLALYNKLSAFEMSCRLGKNPFKVMANSDLFIAEQKRRALESGAPLKLPHFRPNKNEIAGLQTGGRLNKATGDMLDMLVYNEIMTYKALNPEDDTSLSKLAKAASEKVANEFVGVRGFILPIARVTQGLDAPVQDPEDVAKATNSVFLDYMKERGLKTPTLYDGSFYNVNRDSISVVSLEGEESMEIPMAEFSKKVQEKIIANIEEGKWLTKFFK